MRDYAELVKSLRLANKRCSYKHCGVVDICTSQPPCVFKRAADAIEELQGKLKELYYLTCDINANEINAQIEWGNLDNFLRAFRKYADKIAGMKLPEPPKEVE